MVNPKEIDWSKITFSLSPTAFMYVAHCQAESSWELGKIEPYGNISISPAACVLNYGQGLFEGLKAYHSKDGTKIVLFRPTDNADRMTEGCRRLCIPPITRELFIHGVTEVVKANKDFVPPYIPSSQGSLYVRPVVWGTGAILGVKPAPEYTFLVYASPVGPYFKEGFKPIKLKIEQDFHRAAPGGTGGVKAIGNYACGLLPAKKAKEDGYSEILYLDAKENKYVEEVGAANFFCIKKNVLMTPKLDGTILSGVTRRSIMQLAKDRLKLTVEEKKVTLKEVLDADEAFASGTAAVVSPIGLIHYDDKDYTMSNGKVGPLTQKLYDTLLNIQYCGEPDPYGWIHTVC